MRCTDVEDWSDGLRGRRAHACGDYCRLGPHRSIAKAWRYHKTHCEGVQVDPNHAPSRTWKRWSLEDDWVLRAAQHDRALDKMKRQEFFNAQVEATKRHARVLAAAIAAASLPLRVALEAASSTAMDDLRSMAASGGPGFRAALEQGRHASALLPGLVAAERLVLGLSSASLDVREDGRSDEIARAIVRDPGLTALAVELLDKVAGTGAGSEPAPHETEFKR